MKVKIVKKGFFIDWDECSIGKQEWYRASVCPAYGQEFDQCVDT